MTLPTPPTLEQRLDAAAEEWLCPVIGKDIYAQLTIEQRQSKRDHVEHICRAFAPEHFKDPHNETGKD